GHLMLYNTPESFYEKLPLYHEAKGLTITADARIDNREELFEKLYTNDSDKDILAGESLIPDSTLITRIDNREELFEKLYTNDSDKDILAGESLIPDSTLILKAYEVYGEECIHHLIGDFAFAIWDESQQKLFCARDH